MTQQILYTSAPKGLKPGSRGFCTVMSSSGMAKNLAERLESLSAYTHAHLSQKIDPADNPVNYSHLIMRVGGHLYHILSRICDAGVDYTRRTNKLAHHVVLEQRELGAADPAWVLSEDGFCETKWDGNVGYFQHERLPRQDPYRGGVCTTWKQTAGDAGWAGVLAASALKNGRPMSVVFPPGTNALPLVVEALSLLEPDQQWNVTFSTYFTNLPAGIDCQWRFILDGTQDARLLRNNPHASFIDLCQRRRTDIRHELVERARSGDRSTVSAQTHGQRAVRTAVSTAAGPPPPPIRANQGDAGSDVAAAHGTGPPGYAIGKGESRPTVPPASGRFSSHPLGNRKSPLKNPYLWAIGGLSTVVVGLLIALGVILSMPSGVPDPDLAAGPVTNDPADTPATPDSASPPPNDPVDMPDPAPGSDGSPDDSSPPDDGKPSTPNDDPPVDSPDDPSRDLDMPDTHPNDRPAPNEPPKPGPPAEPEPPKNLQPLAVILNATDNVLELPEAEIGMRQDLCKVDVKNPDVPRNCDIRLLGQELVFGKEDAFRVDRANNNGEASWTIVFKKVYGSTGDTLEEPACAFYLKDGVLSFTWLSHSDRAKQLRYCPLAFVQHTSTWHCRLFKPIPVAPQPIDLCKVLKNRKVEGELGLPTIDGGLPKYLADHLRFRIVVNKGSIHERVEIDSENKRDATLTFSKHGGDTLATLYMTLSSNPSPRLVYQVSFYLPKDSNSDTLVERQVDINAVESKSRSWTIDKNKTLDAYKKKIKNQKGLFRDHFKDIFEDIDEGRFNTDGYPPPGKLMSMIGDVYSPFKRALEAAKKQVEDKEQRLNKATADLVGARKDPEKSSQDHIFDLGIVVQEKTTEYDNAERARVKAEDQEKLVHDALTLIKDELQPFVDDLSKIEYGIAACEDVQTFTKEVSQHPLVSVWIYFMVRDSEGTNMTPVRVDLVWPAPN